MHRTATIANGPTRRRRGRHLLALVCGLLVSLSLTACDLRFDREEVHLRFDSKADTLDVLLVYRGVRTENDSDQHLAKAMKILPLLLEGRRQFMVLYWPLYWDLDSMRDAIRTTLTSAHSEQDGELSVTEWQQEQGLAERYGDLIGHFEMRDQGLFLDEDGVLCGFQWLRVNAVSTAVARANGLISEELIESIADGDWEDDDEVDARTIELWGAHARSGSPWFGVGADGISVSVPLSAPSCAELRRSAILGLADSDEDDAPVHLLAALATQLRSLRFTGEGVTATFGGDRPGRMSFEVEDPEMDPSTPLLERVRAAGLPIDPEHSLESVRALLD